MKSAIILVLALSAVSTLPIEDPDITKFNELLQSVSVGKNSDLENLVLNLLESLRELMRNGSDNVPVLDPVQIDNIIVDENVLPSLGGSHLMIKDLSVKHLSTFDVDLSIAQSIIFTRYRITIDGNIPVIEVETENYDLNLNLLGFQIYGNGKLDFKILNPRLTADMEVRARISLSGIYLEIHSADLKFTLDTFDFAITGLFNDEGATDFVNIFLRILISDLLEEYQVEVDNLLTTTVLEVGNEILKDLNLIDIIRPSL